MICRKKITREENGKEVVNYVSAIKESYINKHKLNHQEVVLLHLLHFGYITNHICSLAYGYDNGESIIRNLKKHWGVTFDTIKQKGITRFKKKSEYVEYHITNPSVYREALK